MPRESRRSRRFWRGDEWRCDRLRGRHPRAARAWLAAALLAGLAFGGTQYLRGAHYPSHTLWTAWLCWLISWLALAPPWRTAPIPR